MGLYYETGNGWALTKLARKELGADAYLCCPGPSLANVDASTLNGPGRLIFAINTAYPKVKPDYWMGLDGIECYNKRLLHEPFMKVFRGTYYDTMMYRDKPVRKYPNVFWASMKEPEKGKTLFDYRGHEDHFVWHKNTLAAMLHFMVWMGATRIYLVGCDMGGDKDYYDDRQLSDFQRDYNRRLYKSQIEFLKEIASIGIKRGVTIYSCTPDSPINEFLPYVVLKDALEASEERVKVEDEPVRHVLDTREITVVTMYKSGGDYNIDYVYRLREGVARHLPSAKFVCVSDTEIDQIETIPLKYNFGTKGAPHWCKIELFEHFKTGKILYIDLSVIIQKDLTPLTTYKGFTMTRDFVNPAFKSSCVMSWDGDYSYITEKFKRDPEHYMRIFHPKAGTWKSGFEQLFVETEVKDAKTFNTSLISSYKVSTQIQIEKAVIVKYHGHPRPHEVNWSTVKKPKTRWEILANIIRDNNLSTVCELGVGKLKTFSYLLDNCPDTTVIGIDRWETNKRENIEGILGAETYEDWYMEAYYNKAMDLVRKHSRRALLFRMSTNEASRLIAPESLDLIFIDADHSYSGVYDDITNWLPKVKRGGYIYGHDIDWASVKEAVETHFGTNYNTEPDNVWWVKKE